MIEYQRAESLLSYLDMWDRRIFFWINSLGSSALDGAMGLLSGQLIWLPFIVFAVFLFQKKRSGKELKFFILFMLLALICSDVTSSYIFKNVFQRLRPCRVEDIRTLMYSFGQKCGGRFGFVSSHAANSFALVIFTLQVLRLKGVYWLILIIPGLVSLSRIYLGVHYPGDILGGIIVGTFWGMIFAKMLLAREQAVESSSPQGQA